MKTKIRPTEVPRDTINGLIIDARCVKFTQKIPSFMNQLPFMMHASLLRFGVIGPKSHLSEPKIR